MVGVGRGRGGGGDESVVNPLLFRKLTGYPRSTDSLAVPATSHRCLHTSPVDLGSSRSRSSLPPQGLCRCSSPTLPGEFLPSLPSPQALLSRTTS